MTRKAIFKMPENFQGLKFFPEHMQHSGQTVNVLESGQTNCGTITFTIQAADGWEGEAYEDELTFIEE